MEFAAAFQGGGRVGGAFGEAAQHGDEGRVPVGAVGGGDGRVGDAGGADLQAGEEPAVAVVEAVGALGDPAVGAGGAEAGGGHGEPGVVQEGLQLGR